MSRYSFHVKRIYDNPSEEDGYRVLVDRLWPRGVSKEDARLDEWLKEVAPSTELRKWFDHDSQKFDEFRDRYQIELSEKEEAVSYLIDKSNEQPVTLLYAAKDTTYNHAVVLKDFLQDNQIKNYLR